MGSWPPAGNQVDKNKAPLLEINWTKTKLQFDHLTETSKAQVRSLTTLQMTQMFHTCSEMSYRIIDVECF